MSATRATFVFLDSGEFQYGSPLVLFGHPATVKVSEKDIAVRLNCTGTWELNDDLLRVRITQSNQPSTHFDEPWDYKVISKSEKKLELQKQPDGERVVLFRDE